MPKYWRKGKYIDPLIDLFKVEMQAGESLLKCCDNYCVGGGAGWSSEYDPFSQVPSHEMILCLSSFPM